MDKRMLNRHPCAMAEIVNLRIARKAKSRAEAAAKAAENRARFGRSRAEKAAEAADAGRASKRLDQAKRDQRSPSTVDPETGSR
jgi:hypothetical protein